MNSRYDSSYVMDHSKTRTNKSGSRSSPQFSSNSSSVFDVQPCALPTCKICTGKLKPIPPTTLEALNSPHCQQFVNEKLKVGELPKLKSTYRNFWIHQNPVRRRGRHPTIQECSWYFVHKIAKEDAVLESYIAPPPIVIATHNSLAPTRGYTVRPLNYRPYAHLEQARSRKKRSHVQTMLGHFGVRLPVEVRDSVTIINASERLEYSDARGLTIISSRSVTLTCQIPIRIGMSLFGFMEQFNSQSYVCSIAKVSSSLMLKRGTSIKASAKVVPSSVKHVRLVEATLIVSETKVVRIPAKTPRLTYPPARLGVLPDLRRRYRSWRVRFKVRRRLHFSTTLSSRGIVASLDAEI